MFKGELLDSFGLSDYGGEIIDLPKGTVIIPKKLIDKIIDYKDYATWKTDKGVEE